MSVDGMCECEGRSSGGPLDEYKGLEIDHIEVIGGGHKYCNIINIFFKGGRVLNLEREMDVSKYGIIPKIKLHTEGSWFRFDPKSVESDKDKE